MRFGKKTVTDRFVSGQRRAYMRAYRIVTVGVKVWAFRRKGRFGTGVGLPKYHRHFVKLRQGSLGRAGG